MSRTSTHRPQSINKPPLRELGRAPCFHWSESPVESEVGGLNLGDGKVFIWGKQPANSIMFWTWIRCSNGQEKLKTNEVKTSGAIPAVVAAWFKAIEQKLVNNYNS